MTRIDVREQSARPSLTHQPEAILVSRATAGIAAVLVAVAGAVAYFGMLQVSGLALLAALAMSIASVAGRPGLGYRWVAPVVVGVAMLAVIVASFFV